MIRTDSEENVESVKIPPPPLVVRGIVDLTHQMDPQHPVVIQERDIVDEQTDDIDGDQIPLSSRPTIPYLKR